MSQEERAPVDVLKHLKFGRERTWGWAEQTKDLRDLLLGFAPGSTVWSQPRNGAPGMAELVAK